jgi:hypothetical protein
MSGMADSAFKGLDLGWRLTTLESSIRQQK